MRKRKSAWLAQLVERGTFNPKVAGSIPALGFVGFLVDFINILNYQLN